MSDNPSFGETTIDTWEAVLRHAEHLQNAAAADESKDIRTFATVWGTTGGIIVNTVEVIEWYRDGFSYADDDGWCFIAFAPGMHISLYNGAVK